MLKPGQVITTKTINNKPVTLRLPQESDAKDLQQYVNQLSQERTFVSFQGEQMSLEEEQEYLDELLKQMKEKKGLLLLAFTNDELIGNLSLHLKERTEKHIGVLGISVKNGFRNLGLGTELLKQLLQLAKQELPDMEIVTLSVYANNDRAKHVYQKLGFKPYGSLPNGVKREEGYFDHDYMYLALS